MAHADLAASVAIVLLCGKDGLFAMALPPFFPPVLSIITMCVERSVSISDGAALLQASWRPRAPSSSSPWAVSGAVIPPFSHDRFAAVDAQDSDCAGARSACFIDAPPSAMLQK